LPASRDECVRLGRGEPALGVDLDHVVDEADTLIAEARAGVAERRDRRRKRAADGFVEFAQQQPLRNSKPQSGKRDRINRLERLTRHDVIRQRAIRNVTRHRSDRIEGECQRKCALRRYSLLARLEADGSRAQCSLSRLKCSQFLPEISNLLADSTQFDLGLFAHQVF
jgi:hypothetical protein